MSDPPNPAVEAGEVGPAQPMPDEPKAAPPPYRAVAIGLAATLLLVIVMVGTAPFWASELPWAPPPAKSEPPPDPRVDRVEAAQQQAATQRQQDAAAANAALQRLEQRLAAVEARPAALPAGEIADLRQQLTKLSAAVNDLAARADALDQQIHARATTDATDMALLLTVLQIRGAVEAGRPFPAEYEALSGLARSRPEIAAAAAPLAEPAKTGVAGRAVLADRLRQMAGVIQAAGTSGHAAETPDAAAAAPDWTEAALRRLRGLVTIRRIDGDAAGPPREGAPEGPPKGPGATVQAAERELAGGNLDGAVATLGQLTGAPAEAAGPWLGMARQRLVVEAALRQIEARLAARLGAAATAPGNSR